MTLPYSLERDLMDRKTRAVDLFNQGYGSDLGTLGRLLSLHAAWPDLAPGAKLSFAQAGLTPDDPTVHAAARLQAAQTINRDAWMKALPDTTPKQQKTPAPDHIQAFIGRLQKVGSIEDFAAIQKDPIFKQLPKNTQKAVGEQAIKGQLSGGLISDITSGLGYSLDRASRGDIIGAVAGPSAQQAVPQDQDLKLGNLNVSQTGRDIVRETAQAGISGLQATQGIIRNEVGGGTPLFSASGQGLAEQTTTGQELHGLSAGDGILPDPQSPAALAAANVARQTAPTISGHAFTIGRATALGAHYIENAGDSLGNATGVGVLNTHIFQPGSTSYNALSGLVDAGIAIKGDPTAQILRGIGDAREAGHLFTPEQVTQSNAVTTNTGLAPLSVTPEALPDTKTAWLNSPSLTPKFDAVSRMKSDSAILRYLGGPDAISPEIASQLAEAPDISSVRQVFNDNTLPYKPTFGGAGYEVQSRLDSRLLAQMPNKTLVDLEDKPGTWTQFERLLQSTGMPESQRNTILDNYLHSTNHAEAMDVMGDGIAGMILQHRPVDTNLLDQAAAVRARAMTLPVEDRDSLLSQARDLEKTARGPEDFANKVAKVWKEATSAQRAYDVDQSTGLERIRRGMVVDGNGVPFPNATADSERLNSLVRLPKARDLRKLTTKYGALLDNPAIRNSSEAIDGLVNAWKTTIVARPQLLAKIAGESQFNLMMRDYLNVFSHPKQFMDLLAGTNMDNRFGQFLANHTGADPSFLWDVKGQPILDEAQNLLQGSIRYPGQDPAGLVTLGFHNAPITDPRAAEGLVESIGRMYTDPIFRGVAQQDGPEAAKEWFWGATSKETLGGFMPTGEPTAEGLPELFHGTSQRFQGDAISVGSGSGAGNLLGPGFYSTDNPEVAASYMQKGRGLDPHVYSTRWQGEAAPRILDAEQPVSAPMADTIREWWAAQSGGPSSYFDPTEESHDAVIQALDDNAPLTEVIGKVRKAIASTGEVTRADADEMMVGLADRIQSEGYDALRYSGGVRTGNQTHNAYVFLDESNVGVHPLQRGLPARVEVPHEDPTGAEARLARAPITAHDDLHMSQAVAAGKYGDGAVYHAIGDIANDRAAADGYLDSAHFPRLNDLTGGHEDLLDAVRTGKLNGKPLMIHVGNDSIPNPSAVDEAQALLDAGYGPKAWVPVRDTHTLPGTKPGMFNRAMDWTFHYMLDVPDKVMDRVPAYVQAYWKRAIDQLPYAPLEDYQTALRNAESANLPDELLNKVRNIKFDTTDTPRLSLQQIHDGAKAMAVTDLGKVAHDLTTRTNLFDRLRWFVPFGDAWRLVMKRAAQLVVDEPQVLQRLNAGIYEAKQPGSSVANTVLGNPVPAGQPFFHKDPVTGELAVSVPGSGLLTQATFGVPIPLDSSVKGLTMAADAMPGVGGPLLTLPAKWLLPDTPTGNNIKDVIFPFGGADSTGPGNDLASQFVPGWALKMSQSYPNYQAYASAFNSALKTLASTGNYDLNKPADLSRLAGDAKDTAKWMYTIRGAAQFLIPGAPTEQNLTKDTHGKWVDATVLAHAYRTKQEELGSDGATKWLINNWGVNNIFATQAASQPVGYASPTTTKGEQFVQAHPEVRSKYPLTFGLIVPAMPKDKFDLGVYQRESSKGSRTPLSEAQQVAQAENRLGFFAYNQAYSRTIKANGGLAPDGPQRDALSAYRKQLAKAFPGFDTFTASPYDTVKRRNQAINELATMADDPTITATPAGAGLAQYLNARNQAIDQAIAGGGTSPFRAKAGAGLRQWLRTQAANIIDQHPEFAPMWNDVFSREMVSD